MISQENHSGTPSRYRLELSRTSYRDSWINYRQNFGEKRICNSFLGEAVHRGISIAIFSRIYQKTSGQYPNEFLDNNKEGILKEFLKVLSGIRPILICTVMVWSRSVKEKKEKQEFSMQGRNIEGSSGGISRIISDICIYFIFFFK